MDLMNKLTIKNLKLNKKRTIVTIMGILLSVALLTAVSVMFFSAHASLVKYEIGYKGNYHYLFLDVPAERLKEFQQNRKIESICLAEKLGYAEYEGIQNPDKPYLFVEAFDENALENLAVDLLEGRLPENEGEVLIPAHLKNNGGVTLKVGEKLTLEVGKRISNGLELDQDTSFGMEGPEEIVNTVTKEYTVVGVMERLPYEIESYSGPGYTVITRMEENTAECVDVYVRYGKKGLKDHLAATAGILEVDEAAFRAVNNYELLEALSAEEQNAAALEADQAVYDWRVNSYLITLETGILSDSFMKDLARAVAAVLLIIIATSVFCIRNSFDISITEKIRQYGMLSSIGATRRQIRRNVCFEAAILGCAGIPLGILAGLLAAWVLVHVSNYFLMESLELELIFSPSFVPVLASAVLGGVTVALSAGRSAAKASRVSPISAIRSADAVSLKASGMRVPWLIRKLFGIGGEISWKNLKRSRRKYRTTVISITICVSVFIACTSFVNMAFGVIQTEYKNESYNLRIRYAQSQTNQAAIEELRNLEGVEKFSRVIWGCIQVEDGAFSAKYRELHPTETEETDYLETCILDEPSFQEYVEGLGLDYEKVKGKGILYNDCYEVLYDENYNGTEVQYEKYTYRPGDILKGKVQEWSGNVEETVEVEIGKITKELPIGVYRYSVGGILIVGEEYEAVFAEPNEEEILSFYAENPTRVQEEAEKLLADASLDIYNREENARQMEAFYVLIAIFLYGFIIVIALIGVTNIFNTITTNMNLRRREFAMLKSVGMTPKEFHRMIWLESFFYGMKSLFLGIPLGNLLSILLHAVLMNGAVELQYVLPVNAVLISMAAVLFLITVIMWYSIRKIERQNIIETIRNENI